MHLDAHYVDPGLVALYDDANPRGVDTAFYVALAAELGARTIIDFGCGTGLQTRALATDGRVIIGIDPAPAMLDYARCQPDAERVTWIEGDASALGHRDADLVTMMGNVAQVFLDDAEWAATLRAIHDALRPGGVLAFESRHPDDRAWERWTPEATRGLSETAHGPLEEWMEVVQVGEGRVHLRAHNVFKATGEVLVVDSTLRFRTEAELHASLTDAGFTVEEIYGDWQRGPLTPQSRVMIVVACREDAR